MNATRLREELTKAQRQLASAREYDDGTPRRASAVSAEAYNVRRLARMLAAKEGRVCAP